MKLPLHEKVFEVGARVRLSPRGRAFFRQTPERRGVIVAVSKTGTAFRVKWDTTKDADFVHASLLEEESVTSGSSRSLSKDVGH